MTLSLPRNLRFEGLALESELERRGLTARCGLAVIDLASGRIVEWMWFESHIREMFDVAALPGLLCPMAAPMDGPALAALVTFEGDGACPAQRAR